MISNTIILILCVQVGDKIGIGRFSTVHAGNWHGDVAIKILNTEYLDDEGEAGCTLEAFRLDVTTFRKTRHENLILFMGACMNPPKLAIVTSLCKGEERGIGAAAPRFINFIPL